MAAIKIIMLKVQEIHSEFNQCDNPGLRMQDTSVNQDPGMDSGQGSGICKYCVTHRNPTSPSRTD